MVGVQRGLRRRGATVVPIRQWASVLVSGAAVLVGAATRPVATAAQQRAAAPTALVLDRVTVVDVERGTLVPGQRVVINGNRIQAVGSPDKVAAPKDASIVNAEGKYLIPGLWDVHVHTTGPQMETLLLANGVTGMRDAWSPLPLDTLIRWRREILDGARVGPPRQILSGAAIDTEVEYGCTPGALTGHTCMSLDTADARRMVNALKAAGADMIKTYAVQSREMYFAVARAARQAGLPFGGHIQWGPLELTAAEASDSGARIIDHLNASGGLDSLCMGLAGERASDTPPSVERCGPSVERFRRNGTWFAPTAIAYAPMGLKGPHSDPVLARVQEYGQAFLSGSARGGNWLRDSATAAASKERPDSDGIMQLMDRLGMPILAGSDIAAVNNGAGMVPGFALHGELAMLVAEGMPPLHALQAATLNPAKTWHATDSLGTVAPGKLADLVLLDADPLADITNTTTIRAVIANGRYYDRAALDQLLADVRRQVADSGPEQLGGP